MRVCGPKFDLPAALANTEVPVALKSPHEELVSSANSLINEMDSEINALSTSRALGKAIDLVTRGNAYLQEHEPWTHSPQSMERLTIIKDGAELARVSAIALQPFIPELASDCLDRLNVDVTKRSFKFAKYGADLDYGQHTNRKGDPPLIKL
jgi:methionyl-tRNA synthetase